MKVGARIGFVDKSNGRSSHVGEIPKGGGIGILLVLVLSSIILNIPLSLFLPTLVISFIGFWGGDLHRMGIKGRLTAQFSCALFFLICHFYINEVHIGIYLLSIPLSIFIVGTSNFYNFMDGIDGIAGITGIIGFGLLGVFYFQKGGEFHYLMLCLLIACACLGFLCFNIPKAKVFLGDVGSILLGFLFACLVVLLSENFTDFIVAAGFIAPFYFDELSTMVVRLRDGDSIIVAHRKHLYQLLANELAIEHWKISVGYGIVQAAVGLSLILIRPYGLCFILPVLFCYTAIFIGLSLFVRKSLTKI